MRVVMGHLCSCHRQTNFDKRGHAVGSGTWIHKLRVQYRYLSGHTGGGHLPPFDVPPINHGNQHSTSSSEADLAVIGALPASLPASPVPSRGIQTAAASASPPPRRMHSMVLGADLKNRKYLSNRKNIGDQKYAEECTRPCSVALSTSLMRLIVTEGVSDSTRRCRHATTGSGTTMSCLLRHASDLVESSGVGVDLLADLLRRDDVISNETATAVRRCVSRPAACQLLAEVVASKDEVTAMSDALRLLGCENEADCLAAVQSLLHFTDDLSQLQPSNFLTCHSSPAALVNECLPTDHRPRDYDSGCPTGDVKQTGNSSVDVDVVYVDPLTGSTTRCHDNDEDATPKAHASCPHHRQPSSLCTRAKTTSLPSSSLDKLTCSCVHGSVAGVPVASATFRQVCFYDRLADRLSDVLLRHPRSFRVLTFVRCQRVDACLRRIRRNLVTGNDVTGARPRLSRLHVRLSPLEDANSVAELAEVLPPLSLHALSLTGCGIRSPGCLRSLVTVTAGSGRGLSQLDLGFNDVADVAPLCDALTQTNCSLCGLRLRGNALGLEAVAALFGALRRNCRLEVLDVGGNPIGEKWQRDCAEWWRDCAERRQRHCAVVDLWRIVAEALLSNRSLRELRLDRCSLGVEACTALGRVLAANTTLEVLDVSLNASVGDLGVALLADGLRRNPRCRLHTLALNMCDVSNAGFRSLLVAVKDGGGGATCLQHVKLCYNHIDASKARRRRRLGEREQYSQRARPASAHYELLHSQDDELLRHLAPVSSDQPAGINLERSGWLTGAGGRGIKNKVMPSSTPTRRKNTVRPLSTSLVTSNNLLAEATDNQRYKQPMTSFTAPEGCDVCTDSAHDTRVTMETVHHQAKRRPVPGMTPSEQMRTVVDGDWGWIAVKERLPALTELPNTNSKPSLLERLDYTSQSSSVDCQGPWLDAGQLSTTPPSTDDDEDLDVDDDDDGEVASIYVLLCHVLRANPQLKLLLWGNQKR